MSKSRRNLIALSGLVLLVAWDLVSHRPTTFFISSAHSAAAVDEPLQMDGLPILRPGTLTLGEGRPTVAIAASIDEQLQEPAPIDAVLSYEQVDAVVRRALDLDQSGRSLRDIIDADDWVLLKVNMVTNRGNRSSAYYTDGFEHPGQITDLRVVKSVINYLVEHVGPRRITIAEGGAESPRRGEPGFPTSATEDGWSVTYPEFADLSYMQILSDFASVATVVATTDLNYAPYRREPVPGGPVQRLGVTRLTYPGSQFGFHMEGTGRFPDEGFFMPEPILDADKIISMPAMKTTIYGTTLGIKNYVGTLASGAYGDGTSKRQHYRNNPEHGYVDLFSYNPSAYTIIEGFWGTEGDGPQWGLNVQHNVVVVGADPVATEAVANVTMGFNPLDLEALYLAAAKGFGTLDLNHIGVEGRSPESVQRDFIKSGGGGGSGIFYGRGIRRWLVAGPFAGGELDATEHLPGEADLLPAQDQPAGDANWQTVEHLGYTAEILELGDVLELGTDQSGYAFTLIHADRPQEGFLWFSHDNRARAWLNGEVVYEQGSRRNFQLAANRVPVRLEAGENRLLLKQSSPFGGGSMAAHIVDEDGDRLPGVRFHLPGEVSTAVEEALSPEALPAASSLVGNYPNPFNPATMIRFQLPAASPVELAVFDIAGQRIRTLLRGNIEAGHHEAAWDGRDATGHSVASGVYLAVLSGVDFRHTHSMLLLR
ncbi:MAG: DUF362 domain-containing protein [Gemmatimonadetes bacterium]|nr:DUF362 domain-containing protein [Gemmatimonadota bacterium]